MSLSGRQQTLLNIYGAVNDKKKKIHKKPQRPISNSTNSGPQHRNSPRVSVVVDRSERDAEKKITVKKQPIPVQKASLRPKTGCKLTKDEKLTDGQDQLQATRLKYLSGTADHGLLLGGSKLVNQECCRRRLKGDKNENVAPGRRSSGLKMSENAFISLYGDGFLEVPLSSKENDTECSRLSGDNGFSICLLLFKAADTEKHKVKVEADGARHKSPEIDDSGEFVRWLCCGCTNRSIFGCSASVEEENLASSGFSRVYQASESTPKLLVAKLYVDNSLEDETTFSIYDRGVVANYREKGQDGGCHVRWRNYECWANNYEVPSNRWVQFKVVFDCRYLQIFFDNELVECARIQTIPVSVSLHSGNQRGRRAGGSSQWVQAPSNTNSVYIGGHPSYAKSVRDWRARIGFVGLISSFQLWKTPTDHRSADTFISLIIPELGSVRDNSSFQHVVNAHRNVFWRQSAPPIWTLQSHSISSITNRSIVLLGSFFDGAYEDVGVASSKSFENLLLSALQSGDIRVLIEFAEEFSVQRSHDHVCRSQLEYIQKSSFIVTGIEQMSPLLNVVVNSEETRPPVGSFEIFVELSRTAGKNAVIVVLHSMITSGCFPNLEEIKKKIEFIVLFEAKRSPGEEIHTQAFRHLFALAGQSKHNRERIFIESIINRKLVLTERKVAAEFGKIGFFFASSELPTVVADLKRIQDNYSRAQNHRMDDLPSLSMLTPTPAGLYTLPFMNTLLVSSTMTCENGASKSLWRFVCVLVDYNFQLVDFVHEGCPVTKRGGISYRQGQSICNGIVDRVSLRLTTLSSKVYCVLFSLQKIGQDGSSEPNFMDTKQTQNQMSRVQIQLENLEEQQILGMFNAKPSANCKWFTLAAVYRSKKKNIWLVQAIGMCGNATSIHASLDEINVLLGELRIIQTYEVRVHFVKSENENEKITIECEEFARLLAKNIRFGRNGRILLIPLTENSEDNFTKCQLRITLKLQEVENEIEVYTHRPVTRTLPTLQSIYRTLLRLLSQHGIKECLQQNPFAAQNKRVKRHVNFRVVSAQSNIPVDKVHVFVEKNITFDALSSNLTKTVLPTLMMGSRLMSIRRRLQQKRTAEITREVAETFANNCIAKALKRATIATNLDVKLFSVVRARALLKRIMRLRYDKIKTCIIERARKSERTREYSQSFFMRLQRTFTPKLVLSCSERDLLQHSTRGELQELEMILKGGFMSFTEKKSTDEGVFLEEWRAKKSLEAINLRNIEPPSVENQHFKPEEASSEVVKDRRQLFVTDSEGRASCRLIPGSYSLYVFHLDFFEWTSLAAVYPTINAAGLFSGPTTASSSVQEMVIPLDVYRWTYAIQLVDYFHPQSSVKLAGIPFQVTNNCSSERQIVTTDSNGCATWDVCKGLYGVDVLRECSCVLYSALKQVVVDGGRYRTSKTIPMPVLFGGVKVTVLVVLAAPLAIAKRSELAKICFHPVKIIENASVSKRNNVEPLFSSDFSPQDDHNDGDVTVGTSKAFKLRLGTYRLQVTLRECFSVSLPVEISWDSSKTQAKDDNRYLAVLSPRIATAQTFRVILSYVDGIESLDLILEVWRNKTLIGHTWRQNSDICIDHVNLEVINSIEGCEYQSFVLNCQQGFIYKCFVASNLCMTNCLRPQVQIYSSAGLIYQCFKPPSIGELYWHVCYWDINGKLNYSSTRTP